MKRLAKVVPALWIGALWASSLAAQSPLRQNRLIAKLEQGRAVVGLTIENRSVEAGRWLKASGLDFIVIDMEHQVYDFTAVRDLILGLYEQPFSREVVDAAAAAVAPRAEAPFFPPPPPPTPIVKIARRGYDAMQFDVRHALKMGAMGVFVPFVESRADIEPAVKAAMNAESRYILRGERAVWKEQNNPWPLHERGEFLVGAMIESPGGEENIDEILDTPGLGMLWIAHPSSEEVAREILEKAVERGIFVAGPGESPESFAADFEAGYRMFFLGWDRDLFYRGLNGALSAARESLGPGWAGPSGLRGGEGERAPGAERAGRAQRSAPGGAPPPPTALVGATLVDGTGRAPVPDAVVVIRDGRIACAGPRDACPVPEGVSVVDVRGRWIIPGLVDAHVHYSQTGWADGRPDALDMRERFPYAATVAGLRSHPERFFQAYLCSGVTATFDVGGYPWTWELRAVADTSTRAPHVAAAGPLISARDHWVNVPAERQFLYMRDDTTVRNSARFLLANRTDAVKIWYLVGRTSPDTARFKRLLRVAAREAEAAGTPLIVHATGLWQAKDALRAGAKLLVHSVYDRPVDEEFLALARRNGTVYNPTLIVSDGYAQLRARSFRADAWDLACVDPATRAKAFLTDSLPGGQGPEERARAGEALRKRYELMLENLRRVHEAGIPVAMGTDAGNPLTLHGPAVFLEMEAMQEAGLTPMEVLTASTRNGALAMGRLADFGTVEAGKAADLVVLDADPTADIANVRRIVRVVRAGKVWRRSELEFGTGRR